MTDKKKLMNLTKEELVDTIISLAIEFRKYKNSNTPPSSNKHLKPDTSGRKAKKNSKRGAPIGHIGTTKILEPEVYDEVDTYECPNCHGNHVYDKKILKRKNEEIEEPQKLIAKGTNIHLKHCDDCNLDFIPPQNTTPIKEEFWNQFNGSCNNY